MRQHDGRHRATRARELSVSFGTPSCSYVRGHGARELLLELKGRPPVWGTISRAWCVQSTTARDLVAMAEARGYEVVVTDEEALTLADRIELDEVTVDRGMLW